VSRPLTVEDCLPGYREHVAGQARARAQARWVWLAILPAMLGSVIPSLAPLMPGIPSRATLTIGLAVVLVLVLAAAAWAARTALSDHRRNIESVPRGAAEARS
jgi:hypothetical protein